jgi:putative radical SAM enzyme (TIGR03279 family)
LVEIFDVLSGSEAERAGIRRGDYLISINGHPVLDVLDYSFYITERYVTLKLHREGVPFDVTIKKREYSDIGLEFETFLMDEKRSCRNKCVFCFIDQLPAGLRETLYFKDDDARLSFLQGNYITLTNMSDRDIERIVLMKTSPINISVHTTNPALRVRMLNNRFAGSITDIMRRFADANITMNCQIVLCPGLNDGPELTRTMTDLEELWPHVSSVSVVPVGLTRFREGLYPLRTFTPAECGYAIRQVESFARKCREKHGSLIFWCADEFYIKAGLPVHGEQWYEGYPQLENGVGLITSFAAEFYGELRNIGRYDLNSSRRISLATGAAAYDFICGLVSQLEKRCPNLHCSVYKIENKFLGPEITVAGLVCGCDIKEQLAGKRLGKKLVLPSVMLRAERDMFLDNTTPAELEKSLDIKIEFAENSGEDFIRKILSD